MTQEYMRAAIAAFHKTLEATHDVYLDDVDVARGLNAAFDALQYHDAAVAAQHYVDDATREFEQCKRESALARAKALVERRATMSPQQLALEDEVNLKLGRAERVALEHLQAHTLLAMKFKA